MELRSIKNGRTIYWSGVAIALVGIGIMVVPIIENPAITKYEYRNDLWLWFGTGTSLGGAALVIIGGVKMLKRPESIVNRFNDEFANYQERKKKEITVILLVD